MRTCGKWREERQGARSFDLKIFEAKSPSSSFKKYEIEVEVKGFRSQISRTPGIKAGEEWRGIDCRKDIHPLVAKTEQLLQLARGAEIVHRGLRVVLCGRPNSGKSSLLNALANRNIAIVSELAGTTRDVVEVKYSSLNHCFLFLNGRYCFFSPYIFHAISHSQLKIMNMKYS